MSKRKPPLDEKALAFFRRTGRKGGKRSLADVPESNGAIVPGAAVWPAAVRLL